MTTFESSIRQILFPQKKVYDMLSNLENIERVKNRIPEDKIKDLTFDNDSISVSVPPAGNVRLRKVAREAPTCIKFGTESSPVPFYLWIQILPVSETSNKMKITIKAELNPFIKGMVQKPLQQGIEKIADVLQAINYE